MCKINCKSCNGDLIEISNVESSGYMDRHTDRFGNIIVYNNEVYAKITSKILFCKECREFYNYDAQLYNGEMKNWIELYRVDVKDVFKELSEKFIHIPECIDFKALKEVFAVLKVDFDRATKAIAYNVVYTDKPFIPMFTDEEMPF